MRATYKDLDAKRPVIHKLLDHDEQIQPNEPMDETSEYRSTMNKLQVKKAIFFLFNFQCLLS